MSLEGQMLITAERDGYFGLRAKPALSVLWWSKTIRGNSSARSFLLTQKSDDKSSLSLSRVLEVQSSEDPAC